MIVCVCNALNESSVRQAAQNAGSRVSILKIYESLDATPQCGKCLCQARNICDDEHRLAQTL